MNRGAQKVKAYRESERPKVSQEVFAARYGLSLAQWHRIERGEYSPPLTVAAQLEEQGIAECQDWFRKPLSDDDLQQRAAE